MKPAGTGTPAARPSGQRPARCSYARYRPAAPSPPARPGRNSTARPAPPGWPRGSPSGMPGRPPRPSGTRSPAAAPAGYRTPAPARPPSLQAGQVMPAPRAPGGHHHGNPVRVTAPGQRMSLVPRLAATRTRRALPRLPSASGPRRQPVRARRHRGAGESIPTRRFSCSISASSAAITASRSARAASKSSRLSSPGSDTHPNYGSPRTPAMTTETGASTSSPTPTTGLNGYRAASQAGFGRLSAAASSRLTSRTVSGISPGSAGGVSSGLAGGGVWVRLGFRAGRL